ncbi:eprA1 [Symbiodinium natans]|uniref:EprA1 protein n=1 Tax=Symbiodinium natans TaxID=878477 RepID=A0A812T0Y6_9DINO|nr:eprA1 [Symbiodinium natans]
MVRTLGVGLLVQALTACWALRAGREDADLGNLSFSEFPPLCDEGLVSQTCRHLSGDGSGTTIGKADIAKVLFKTEEQIQHLWQVLDLPADELATCLDVCNAITEYIKDWHVLPPRSDLACYTIGRRWFCDADVRPDQLKIAGLSEEQDLPDLHDQESQPVAGATSYRKPEAEVATSWHLVERVANLFRIFPAESPGREEAFAPPTMDDSSDYTSTIRVIMRSGQIAEAFLGAALRAFENNMTGNQMLRWFGADDANVERNIRLTLNSAADLLSKAHFVYPGPTCTKKQLAYALPNGIDCSRLQLSDAGVPCASYGAKFVLYVCPLFMSHPKQQVLTLIHEASHHAMAFTEDVCADPTKPPEEWNCTPKGYGRATCRLLAEHMQARALINADNYCYYVQDVVDQNSPEWVPVWRSEPRNAAPFTCPPLSVPRGSLCSCQHGNHCFQDGAEGCQLKSSTSLQFSLPSCEDCRCARCPLNARLLPGGICECNEQFHCSTTSDSGCYADLRNFSVLSCPTCFCQRAPPKTKSMYKEHRLCTEPCGSMVLGQVLAENRCAKCKGTDCYLYDCTLDPCKDKSCGKFAYCKAWAGKPQCRCFSQYRQGSDGCHPVIQENDRCCYTGKSQSLIRAVWVPRELQPTNWYFKHICPTVDGIKWRKAPRTECTGVIYQHPDNHLLGLGKGVEI